MKTLFRTFFIFQVISCVFSQAGFAQNWTWTRRESDPLDRYMTGSDLYFVNSEKLAIDEFGNTITYAVVRTKRLPGGADTSRVRINKVDRFGNLIWQKFIFSGSEIFDMKMDKRGNTFAVLSNFSTFNGLPTPAVPGTNCLIKVDPQGKLIWKRSVSACSSNKVALAINPANDNIYFFADAFYSPFQLSDSVYNYGVNSARLMLFRLDTAGKVIYSQKLLGAESSDRNGITLDVDSNDRVLIAAHAHIGIPNIVWGDTTIANTNSKGIIAWINGISGNRIRVKSYFPGVNQEPPYLVFGRQKNNNETGFWVALERLNSGSYSFTIADTTINTSLPVDADNPFFIVFNSEGKVKSFTSLGGTETFIMTVITDGTNFYAGGCKKGYPTANTFSPFVQKINPTGQSDWINYPKNANSNNATSFITSLQLRNDNIMATTRIDYANFPVFGNDTILVPGLTLVIYSTLSNIGGTFNLIKGQVYFDENKNGVKDTNEPGLPNILMTDSVRNVSEFSGFDGRYYIITDTGTFNLKIHNRPRYNTWSPILQTVNFGSTYGQAAINRNFRLTFDTIVRDMSIYSHFLDAFRPGFDSYISINYRNQGNVTMSGTYSLKLDTALQLLNSDSTIVFSSPDSLSWNYSGIRPFEAKRNFIKVRVKPTTPIGYTLKIKSYIYPIITDSIPENNIDSTTMLVRGSYDPNDKLANPLSELNYQNTVDGKQVIDYTIRFQNTGTDTAFNIRIYDQLSDKLDINSFQLLSFSHPVEIHISPAKVLELYFPGVLLPDSNRNEKLSHGFINFRIKPKFNLIITDTIFNSASIYFDYNNPVITNKTKNYFKSGAITGVTNLQDNSNLLKLYPNPAKESVNYELKKSPAGIYMLKIYDMNGRLCFTTSIRNYGTELRGFVSLKYIPHGTYIFEVRSNKIIANKKLLKL
jgi:uncharacterized repeat protein (TIGR01451 family)